MSTSIKTDQATQTDAHVRAGHVSPQGRCTTCVECEERALLCELAVLKLAESDAREGRAMSAKSRCEGDGEFAVLWR